MYDRVIRKMLSRLLLDQTKLHFIISLKGATVPLEIMMMMLIITTITRNNNNNNNNSNNINVLIKVPGIPEASLSPIFGIFYFP